MNLRNLLFGDKGTDPVRADALSNLQREVERVFDDFSRGWTNLTSREFFPRTDVVERDDHIEITAELPGMEQQDVEVTLADNVLTLRGEKKVEREEKEGERRVLERSYGAFTRSIELPPGIKAEDIRASMAKGVLTITLPKPAAAPPQSRKIEINAGA